jgi:hypothetical protein
MHLRRVLFSPPKSLIYSLSSLCISILLLALHNDFQLDSYFLSPVLLFYFLFFMGGQYATHYLMERNMAFTTDTFVRWFAVPFGILLSFLLLYIGLLSWQLLF